ncbi:YIP1 family protein [Candidatus Hodarchaeum mangrovi]
MNSGITDPEKPQFCGNCGSKLIENATFCGNCGQAVTSNLTKPFIMQKPSPPLQYQPGYRIQSQRFEPPLPFFTHFRGVLFSPKEEMARIIQRPNVKQPLIMILIVGILSGIGLLIFFSKLSLTFTEDYINSLGLPRGQISDAELTSIIQISIYISALFVPLGLIVNWVINALILWILHSLFATQVSPELRSYRVNLTVIGWASLPGIFEELINILHNLIFISPKTATIASQSELQNLLATPSSEIFQLFLSILNLIIFLYGILLIYLSIRQLDSLGSNSMVIIIIYTIISFMVPILLSGFFI